MRERADRVLSFVEETVPALLLAAMVAIICTAVFSRYALDRPISWASEVTVALFIWHIFLGVAGAARRRLHIGIEVLVARLPARGRAVQTAVLNGSVLLVLGYVSYLGWGFADATSKHLQLTGLSYQWVYGAVSVGLGLTALHVAAQLVEAVGGAVRGDYVPTSVASGFADLELASAPHGPAGRSPDGSGPSLEAS